MIDYLSRLSDYETPDLIILDYEMPFSTAPEILKSIIHMSRYINSPKVVWSTSTDSIHREECLALGAIAYFVKPKSAMELDRIVEQIFKLFQRS